MYSKLRRISRHVHLWLALVVLFPSVIVIVSGIVLQVKKQFDWVQPPTQTGSTKTVSLSFDRVLATAKSIEQLQVSDWQDIDRLDVRPNKGVIKILSVNHWEAQIDASSAKVLQVAYRRSDTIEAIHDGSWFAKGAKLWVFLPAALLLFVMWGSGCVLLYTTLKSKYKGRIIKRTRRIH